MEVGIEFTIAIPAFNRHHVLEKSIPLLLNQIEKLSPLNGELFVVNDASTDGTASFLEKLEKEYPQKIRIFSNPKNRGISFCRNLLVNEAKGKYLIFLDSDIIPTENLLQEHLKILINKKSTFSQGELILVSKPEQIPNNKPFFATDFSTAFFASANVAIEKKIIIEVGMFDEKFTGYGWEDLELGIRLKKKGIKIFRNKKAIGYHLDQNISLENREKLLEKEINRAKGAVYFLEKHPLIEVKMMTEQTFFHVWLNALLNSIFSFGSKRFYDQLILLEKKKSKYFIPFYRLYLNYIYFEELKKIKK